MDNPKRRVSVSLLSVISLGVIVLAVPMERNDLTFVRPLPKIDPLPIHSFPESISTVLGCSIKYGFDLVNLLME